MSKQFEVPSMDEQARIFAEAAKASEAAKAAKDAAQADEQDHRPGVASGGPRK